MLKILEGTTISSWWTTWTSFFMNPILWASIATGIIKIILILIISQIIVKIAQKALKHIIIEREQGPLKIDPRRTKTIGKLLGNFVTYAVNFIMILMVLSQFGLNLAPVLAGAGVLGLAIGFGAQSLVKDVITGFFIIFEDQFAVGDVIQTGSYKGTVEEIGLRVTRLKSGTGELHIIPNGAISLVTNYSISNSVAIIDISIASDSNIDKAIKILEETVNKHYETSVDMVKPPQVLGIQSLGTTEVTLRVTAECKPNTQAAVTRKIYSAVRRAFESTGVEVPFRVS